MSSTPRAIAILAVVFWAVFGMWAFAAPASFYEAVAVYPPFNAHFLRDAGAFELGLAGAVAAGLRWRDALATALAGTAVAGVFHFAAHVIDSERGGSFATTTALGVLAAIFVAGAILQLKRSTR